MKYREVARRLRALGCEEVAARTPGSHRKWINPEAVRGASIPDWGPKDLRLGTLRRAVTQLGIDWQEFLKAR